MGAAPAIQLLNFRCGLVVFEHLLEREGLKGNTIAHEMFTHGLDPMQTQAVQHGASALHYHQDGN